MILSRDRTELERNLGKALSRHIGYTTGAYHLDRIVSTLDVFGEKPSAYMSDLIASVTLSIPNDRVDTQNRKPPSAAYLEEVVHFSESMSLISSVSQRSARVHRFAPTELGRALLGARESDDSGFYNYFLTRTVLLADADAIYPIIKFFSQRTESTLHKYYMTFQSDLRHSRTRWLLKALQPRLIFKRVVDHIPWLTMDLRGLENFTIHKMSEKTAKHHVVPRRGWLRSLELLDAKEELTEVGRAMLVGLELGRKFFWLGPVSTTQSEMGIQEGLRALGPFEDTFQFAVRAEEARAEDIDSLLQDTAQIMRSGYPVSKLIHASQATLILPIEYIKYRAFLDKRSYNWYAILPKIFDKYRSEFERLSAKRGQVGFFRWKGD